MGVWNAGPCGQRIEARCLDGSVYKGPCNYPKGHGPGHPLTVLVRDASSPEHGWSPSFLDAYRPDLRVGPSLQAAAAAEDLGVSAGYWFPAD